MALLGDMLLELSLLIPHGLLGNILLFHQDTAEHVAQSASPLKRNMGRSKRTRSSLTTNSYNATRTATPVRNAAARAFAARGVADHVVACGCLSLLAFVGRWLPAACVSRRCSAVAVGAGLSARACVCACSCVRLGALGNLMCQFLRQHRCIDAALQLRQFVLRKREPKTVPISLQAL